ncbi:hypothetical protein M0802_004561 [Mischocyttarus mexicanus]|nr:hypothetical protein M0802_004561 [Mischocyttarus mexicanus]
MSTTKRDKVRQTLSLFYALVSWHGFILSLYILNKFEKKTSDLSAGLQKSVESDVTSAKVIRIKGFDIVDNTTFGKEQLDTFRKNIANPPVDENSNDFD